MHHWWIHVMWEVKLVDPWKFPLVSSCIYMKSVSFQSFPELLSCSLLVLSLIAFRRDDFSLLHPLPTVRPGCLAPQWSKVRFGRQSPYHIQWIRLQRMDHLRANPGFGIFWCILSLLAVAYQQPTSSIKRIFFSLSRVDMALFLSGRSALGWPIGGVRPENLTGRILVRNHLHSPYPHKDIVLPHTSLHGSCWQYSTSQCGRSPLRGSDNPFSSTYPWATATFFSRKFNY